MLRNVVDGSVREVETNSDEYVDLLNEMYDHEGSARPKWEITGRHHVQRLDAEDVGEADFGYANKPIGVTVANFDEIGPELHPERALTPAEVEAGIESHEQKMESINAAISSMNAIGHTADRPVEHIEKPDPAERAEAGRAAVGRKSGNGRRKAQGKTDDALAEERQSASASTGTAASGSGSGTAPAAGSGAVPAAGSGAAATGQKAS